MFFIKRFDPEIHHRRSIRLKNWDYSSPWPYFITICAFDRSDFFGVVDNCKMNLNQFGIIVQNAWFELSNHNSHITLDEFVVMPDHIHGIIIINPPGSVGAGHRPALGTDIVPSLNGAGHRPALGTDIVPSLNEAGHRPAPTVGLPEIVRKFKSFSGRQINILRGSTGNPVWQRNYYDHIVRTETELIRIRNYIRKNPEDYF
jgi:putative transposase